MKWKDANFEFEDIAKLCKEDLESAGIRTGDIFQADVGIHNHTRYFVPYMPIGEKQCQKANEIISNHLW